MTSSNTATLSFQWEESCDRTRREGAMPFLMGLQNMISSIEVPRFYLLEIWITVDDYCLWFGAFAQEWRFRLVSLLDVVLQQCEGYLLLARGEGARDRPAHFDSNCSSGTQCIAIAIIAFTVSLFR